MLNISVFWLGWLLFVAAQCKNSLNSKTNSLTGSAGVKAWLGSQSVNLLTRAFFSALGYGFLVNSLAAKIDSVGFHFTSTTISGFAGYAANGMLYQLFGLLPWLRVEVAELAPPAQNTALPKTPSAS
jgi:hypothetical protein